MRVWVDADSCPVRVREIVARAARAREVSAVFVANRKIPLAKNSFVSAVTVKKTEGSADAYICANAGAGDLVITRDIPLAAQLVRQSVTAINDRGDVFTSETISERLSLRNFMKDLRESGLYESPAGAFGPKEIQLFSNAFDRELTRLKVGSNVTDSLVAAGKNGPAFSPPA
jgi:uncharacterized protein YaiI (UPF0178 family)